MIAQKDRPELKYRIIGIGGYRSRIRRGLNVERSRSLVTTISSRSRYLQIRSKYAHTSGPSHLHHPRTNSNSHGQAQECEVICTSIHHTITVHRERNQNALHCPFSPTSNDRRRVEAKSHPRRDRVSKCVLVCASTG